jgi:hypothetical protein
MRLLLQMLLMVLAPLLLMLVSLLVLALVLVLLLLLLLLFSALLCTALLKALASSSQLRVNTLACLLLVLVFDLNDLDLLFFRWLSLCRRAAGRHLLGR